MANKWVFVAIKNPFDFMAVSKKAIKIRGMGNEKIRRLNFFHLH